VACISKDTESSGVDEHRVVPQYRQNEDKQIDIRKNVEWEGILRQKKDFYLKWLIIDMIIYRWRDTNEI
jgi:hypothetical protein